MVYLRKIEETRWRNQRFYDSDIISDLNTTDHDLSVWICKEGDTESKYRAVLAMAMGRKCFSDFFYVEISEEDLKRSNFKLNDKSGPTYYKKCAGLHRNIRVNTAIGLIRLAKLIKAIIKKTGVNYISQGEQESLLRAHASEMSLDDLDETQFKKICKPLISNQ